MRSDTEAVVLTTVKGKKKKIGFNIHQVQLLHHRASDFSKNDDTFNMIPNLEYACFKKMPLWLCEVAGGAQQHIFLPE